MNRIHFASLLTSVIPMSDYFYSLEMLIRGAQRLKPRDDAMYGEYRFLTVLAEENNT
jgi:hypothetical protein